MQRNLTDRAPVGSGGKGEAGAAREGGDEWVKDAGHLAPPVPVRHRTRDGRRVC